MKTLFSYAAGVREEANKCEFGGNYDERILEHLIQTVEDVELIKQAISKKWNLTQFLNEAAQNEDMKLQMTQMYIAPKAPKIAKVNTRRRRKTMDKPNCSYCGTNTHEKGKNCPAFGKKCFNCNKFNHFSKMCRKRKDQSEQKKGKNPKTVKKTEEMPSSDDDFFPQVVKHLTMIKKVQRQGEMSKTIKVKIDDVDVLIEPDSGAEANIMDEHQFKAFIHRTASKATLMPTSVKLTTLQAPLPVKGEFSTIIRNKTCGIETKFLIIKGKIGKPTLLKLGMLKIDPDGCFAETNDMRIQPPSAKKICEASKEVRELLDRHNAIFEGIGEIKDTMAKFTLEPGTQPVAQKPRPIPYHSLSSQVLRAN